MGETMTKSKEIREIVKSFDKEKKLFVQYVDSILRRYDLLKSEYVDTKWLILKDIDEKLSTEISVWDIYEDPKLFCESVVLKHQRKNIGINGRIIKYILPIYFLMILVLFLMISPNGIYQLFNQSNPGVLISVGMIFYIIFLGLYFFLPDIFEDKKYFEKNQKMNILSWLIIVIYFVLVYYLKSLNLKEFIPLYVHPLIILICISLLCVYLFMNRKKLFI